MQTKTLVLALAAVVVLFAAAYFFTTGVKAASYFDDTSPVMYFYSDQCHYCQQQKPILEKLAGEGFRVKQMDVLAHPEYWAQYGITGTPTFVAANGDKQVGFTEERALREWLAAHNAKLQS